MDRQEGGHQQAWQTDSIGNFLEQGTRGPWGRGRDIGATVVVHDNANDNICY